MSKINYFMQNLIVFMEPSGEAFFNSLKAGKMILNRFCIDEDAAFELSGVNYLKNWSIDSLKKEIVFDEKGKKYSFILFYFIMINFFQ